MREIRCSQGSWLEIAVACPYATFFHAPSWTAIAVAAADGWRDRTRAFRTDDGTDVVLPLVQTASRAKGLFRDCESMPWWVYGGPIAERPLAGGEIDELCERLVADRRLGAVGIVGNPLAAATFPGFDRAPDFTQLVRLDGAAGDAAARFAPAARRSLRQSVEAGVRVRWTRDRAELGPYLALREDAERRWGAPASAYPRRLLEACLDRAGEHARLWLAEKDGRPLAGALVFEWGAHAVYWHGASATDALPLRPNHALHAAVLSDLAARGFRVYDLNPSGGHEGVVRFKESLGAEVVPFARWRWSGHAWSRRYARWRSGIAAR